MERRRIEVAYVRGMSIFCPNCEATSEILMADITTVANLNDTMTIGSTCPVCGEHNDICLQGGM
jgi:hypothetical protein